MKKLFTLAVTLLTVSMAFAALDATESFDYSIGSDPVGTSGGMGWSSPWASTGSEGVATVETGNTYTDGSANMLAVAGGSVELNPGVPSGAANYVLARDLTTTYDSGIVYASILVQNVVPNTSLDYGFTIGNVACYIRGWGANWILGEGGNVWSTIAKPAEGETQFLVAKIDIDTNTLEVWMNPDLVTPGAADFTTSSLVSPVGSIAGVTVYEQGGATWDNQVTYFDEIRVGTSFTDVAPVVPEPAMGLFAILALGLLKLRK